jgi:hypothetical protein
MGTRPAPAIGPIQNVVEKLAGEPLTIWTPGRYRAIAA